MVEGGVSASAEGSTKLLGGGTPSSSDEGELGVLALELKQGNTLDVFVSDDGSAHDLDGARADVVTAGEFLVYK